MLPISGKTDRVFKTIFVNDNDYHLMEALLSECLGSDVKVSNNKITIKFSSVQDLNRILDIIDCNLED